MEAADRLIAIPSIVFMGISIGICILFPLFGVIFSRIKGKASVFSGFMGVVAYCLGFLTYGILWILCVAASSNSHEIKGLPTVFYIMRAFLSGIAFALWSAFFLKKRIRKGGEAPKQGFWTSISFYSGFSLAAGVVFALPIVQKMWLALKYNPLGTGEVIKMLEDDNETLSQLYQISSSNYSSSDFLLPGLEFLLMLVGFFSIACLLKNAAEKGKVFSLWLLWAVFFHIALEIPEQLEAGAMVETASKVIILTVAATLAAVVAFLGFYRKKKGLKE